MSDERWSFVVPADHDPRVLDDFFIEMGHFVAEENRAVEHRWRLIVRPKPRWWPEWFYRRMLQSLLYSEVR